MKIKYINRFLIAFSLLFVFAACEDDEDYTGDSVLVPSSPTLTVALDFADSQTLVEAENTYGFTVTLSEPQIVNVVVNLSQTGGTATQGDDFDFPSTVTISKGSTSASGEITIHSDELIEETETATIEIATGLESNVSSITGKTVNFSIMNLTAGDLAVGMSWEASSTTTDNTGTEIGATDLADLVLEIQDATGTAVHTADGASFETSTLLSDDPDGEYFVVASFYAASDIPFSLDLTATFDQTGTINGQTHTFASALNNAATCSDNYYTLVKITKAGSSYTFEEVGQGPVFDFSTTYTGIDAGETSAIITADFCGSFYAHGINEAWMQGFWGEEIQTETQSDVFLSVASDGTVTIASQPIFTTLYDGDLYDYTISGTGTYDASTQTLTLQYFLDQEGFSPSNWAFDNGYLTTEYFEAVITQD